MQAQTGDTSFQPNAAHRLIQITVDARSGGELHTETDAVRLVASSCLNIPRRNANRLMKSIMALVSIYHDNCPVYHLPLTGQYLNVAFVSSKAILLH